MIHTRRIVETSIQDDPEAGVWAMIDIDFVNVFPSLEWDSLDAAVQDKLPEISAWTKWCHSGPTEVFLPSNTTVLKDRGSEQGDPHGSLHCGVVLARMREEAHSEFCRRKAISSSEE